MGQGERLTGRRAAVLGHPIAHSLSPALHRAAYRALGLDGWRYDALDVEESALAAALTDLDEGWAGLSLTMPLKQAVLPLLDHVEPLAGVVGACNTVLVQPAPGRPLLVGANTDVPGLVAAARELGVGVARRAVILGAGATAASALAAVAELGCPTPVVHARSAGRAGGLLRAAHRMGVEPVLRGFDPDEPDGALAASLRDGDLVVSTLPHGAADVLLPLVARVASGWTAAARPALVDVAYDPRPTPLVGAWRAAGAAAASGERMLLHQAAEQVRLMTGREAPLDAMAAALDAT